MSLAHAPQQLSKYRLEEEIGHGGMATVYRARDTRLERDVALKLIHRHLRKSPEIEARFNSEARAIAKLRHPNIVEVYDVSEPSDDERYLIVELVRGTTLRELLRRYGALPTELAAEIVLELASALEHAHAEGVIHRDIKPENVLVELPVQGLRTSVDDLDRPKVKLTDFGIAKLLDAQGVTSTGQVLGSPAHMAPEQIEGKVVDVRADVFSLAVLFYESSVGSLPFDGTNPAQVLRNVLEGNYEPPERVDPRIGVRWSRLMAKGLAKEPEHRFDSISSFADAVREELLQLGFAEPRRDISSFLQEPDGYREGFGDRIVEALIGSGGRARNEKNLPLATDQLCRALAYRPHDKELIKQVATLRRRARIRSSAWWMLAAVVLLGVAVFIGLNVATVASQRPAPIVEPVVHEPPAPEPSLPAVVPRSVVDSRPAPTVENPSKRLRRRVSRAPAAVATTAAPVQTRQVSVRVTGAIGGTVRIDGTERPWFGGVTHELTTGEHVFEFVPPNDTCCTATQRKVMVEQGPGILQVVGRIPFKDARLGLSNAESVGWELSCPTLFNGTLRLPGSRSVAMSQAMAQGTCTLSDTGGSETTLRKIVTLRAGTTTLLPWP